MLFRLRSRSVFLTLSLLCFVLLLGQALYGQGERATVTGTVKDSSGAIVVGAEVSIRNLDTNITTNTKSNAAGIYYLPALPPGKYELRVQQAGFRPSVVADIPLAVGLTATFNVTLEVGAVSETVEVQATAVQLEAQTTGLGKVLQSRNITELPTLGRSVLDMVSILPGVNPTGGGTTGSSTNAKMSGGMAKENAILTDGGESRGAVESADNSVVPLESVAEVRIDTATYSSEYGRSGGGIVNVATKSGTNELHGVGYGFVRNDHLNANSWSNNRSNVSKTLSQIVQYGVAAGGPIIRDKTFFFGNYQKNTTRSPITSLATVPFPEQKLGDFSTTLDSKGAKDIIYDPNTTRPDPARPGQYIRDAFSGNRVPQERFNAISANVQKYWPSPNRPGEGPAQFNNYYISSGKRAANTHNWVSRIDHYLSGAHRIFGRFSGSQSTSGTTGLGSEMLAFLPQSVSKSGNRSALVSLTSTFSPTLLGELRLSYVRFGSLSQWDSIDNFNLSSLGLPSYLLNAVEYKSFPSISISQYTTGTGFSVTDRGSSAEVKALGSSSKSFAPQDTWHGQYHLTWMRNRHKIKAGVEYELLRLNTWTAGTPGNYFFDRQYTQGPDPTAKSSAAGHGYASFLLGVPISGYLEIAPHLMLHKNFYGFYVQDDVKVTSALTLNLGLRYEYTTPFSEKWGRIGNFDFGGTEPVTGAKGTFKFVGPGEYLWNPNKKNFGPRVGLAYSLDPKTVIRAAGGIFYSGTDTLNTGLSDWGNGLFSRNEVSLGQPNAYPSTPPVGGSWSNPFAKGILVPNRTTTFAGENVRTWSRNHILPYISNWTFNIQRMLSPTLVVEVGYVGNKTTHLTQNRFYNQNDPLLLSLGSKLVQKTANPFYGKIQSGDLSYPTINVNQALRPYPQYLQILIPRDGYGDAHYHAFQLRVDKQYSRGLTLTAAYTISKTITNVFESDAGFEPGPQNALYNPNYSRGLDPNDEPHRLVLSYMWEVPFGKGRRYLSNGLAGKVIGNWQMSGITVIQSGVPIRIAGPDNTGLLNFALNSGRGNRLSDPVLSGDQRTASRWFDTNAFTAAPAYTMPTDSLMQPRLREPNRANFDLVFIRNQPIGERYNVQFRAECYNVFNTPDLRLGTGNSSTLNTAQFGQILSGSNPRNIQLGMRILF